jgi:hypothetical protein
MITITLDNNELAVLGAVFDAAIKSGGIQTAKMAMPLFEKLEKAAAEFMAAQSQPKETE